MSKLFSLFPKDFINSVILGFLSAVGFALMPVLESGRLPELSSIPGILASALAVTIANLVRKYLTDQNNNFLGAGKPEAK